MQIYKMILPLSIDKTPSGKLVKRSDIGQPGYGENVEYSLNLIPTSSGVIIEYIGEDGFYLEDYEIDEIIEYS